MSDQNSTEPISEAALPPALSWSGRRPDDVTASDDGTFQVHWQLEKDEPFSATCQWHLPPISDPFWCIPGLFWGDNQQDTTGQYYPRFDSSLHRPARFQSAFWEFHVWRATQPVTAIFDGKTWYLMEVAPMDSGGSLCASVGFRYEKGRPSLIASLPARERPYRPVGHDYTMPFEKPSPSSGEARVVEWKVKIRKIDGVKTDLLNVLKENYHAGVSRHCLRAPAGQFAQATRHALLCWHYQPSSRHFKYTVAFDRVGQQIAEAMGTSLDRDEMALGWVSGWVIFEALLQWAAAKNDSAASDAVQDAWQNLLANGLESPSGFWWTRFAPPRHRVPSIFESKGQLGMDGNWMPDPSHIHMRTLGDAVLRAARALQYLAKGSPFAVSLEKSVRFQATLASTLAARGWPLPLSVNGLTGEPAGLQGTAGMIWIDVWCELASQGKWNDRSLIEQGLDHYRNSVQTGQLFGAPEDIGECVSSEDIYIAVNTYLHAYQITGRAADLETALAAARWIYLWRKSFDHHLDPRTLIGVYDLKSRGGDIASFKNNHLHIYGLDVEDSLLHLAKLTADDRWAALADDHWAFSAQLTPLVDGQFNAYEGMVTEQFYFIDWSALGNSVALFEKDDRRSGYDVGPHFRNFGNLAGFSHAWCTAFVLTSAMRRD